MHIGIYNLYRDKHNHLASLPVLSSPTLCIIITKDIGLVYTNWSITHWLVPNRHITIWNRLKGVLHWMMSYCSSRKQHNCCCLTWSHHNCCLCHPHPSHQGRRLSPPPAFPWCHHCLCYHFLSLLVVIVIVVGIFRIFPWIWGFSGGSSRSTQPSNLIVLVLSQISGRLTHPCWLNMTIAGHSFCRYSFCCQTPLAGRAVFTGACLYSCHGHWTKICYLMIYKLEGETGSCKELCICIPRQWHHHLLNDTASQRRRKFGKKRRKMKCQGRQ